VKSHTARPTPYAAVVDALLSSDEPSIRWKARVGALGEGPDSKPLRALREEIRRSRRVETLLGRRDPQGRIVGVRGVYAKWQGAHWIMASLADLGYPPHDDALIPVRDQILDAWLDRAFYLEFEALTKADAYAKRGVPIMRGRYRRCASQQACAVTFLLKLGLEHERIHDLVERLFHWRWLRQAGRWSA
jgi:hypothetical protein